MHVVLFEGSRWVDLAPLSLTRPVFTLTIGAGTLLEKQLRHLRPSRLTLWVRPELARWCEAYVAPHVGVPCAVNQPLDDEPAMLMSGRTLHLQQYEFPAEPSVVVDEHPQGDVVRAAWVHLPGLSPDDVMERSARWVGLLDLPRTLPQGRMCEHVWDLIGWNEEALLSDFVARQGCAGSLPSGP
ncbi:MAG TPA: putative sugar nucleotidyl transferase, partial [Tepidisphaeraceae bacterium]|nr:putative sugar nucleotidyl transferase [Tepidisphaeraceae bacterium]